MNMGGISVRQGGWTLLSTPSGLARDKSIPPPHATPVTTPPIALPPWHAAGRN
jgi:hypothetical protein